MRCDGGGAMAEFLPLCDVLFNVISLAGYFCDVVFDVVMAYALLERGHSGAAAAAASIVLASLVVSQVLSLRWHLHVWAARGGAGRAAPWLPVALHCLQLGVLWRYAKLFVPNDLRHVKHQVRDLCMLRLVHAFCSAAPMLLLQLHVLLSAPPELPDEPRLEPAANKSFAQLNVISASLSLFSVCWALASFSKNVRLRHVHRLVLTWLGVIFQRMVYKATLAPHRNSVKKQTAKRKTRRRTSKATALALSLPDCIPIAWLWFVRSLVSIVSLNVISASLSLFSVCWALASFSKNVRLRHVHRLVLTWLGVIFQYPVGLRKAVYIQLQLMQSRYPVPLSSVENPERAKTSSCGTQYSVDMSYIYILL
ncbi:unnamed protein product [Plutella xylostella]|uniref:XK-related protein n=1 Tax=Plutella xylostella TaxID=51655 RepID=A0A8S4FA82_PLUXY|nr:unnamed protein product [Plutella xylostella]